MTLKRFGKSAFALALCCCLMFSWTFSPKSKAAIIDEFPRAIVDGTAAIQTYFQATGTEWTVIEGGAAAAGAGVTSLVGEYVAAGGLFATAADFFVALAPYVAIVAGAVVIGYEGYQLIKALQDWTSFTYGLEDAAAPVELYSGVKYNYPTTGYFSSVPVYPDFNSASSALDNGLGLPLPFWGDYAGGSTWNQQIPLPPVTNTGLADFALGRCTVSSANMDFYNYYRPSYEFVNGSYVSGTPLRFVFYVPSTAGGSFCSIRTSTGRTYHNYSDFGTYSDFFGDFVPSAGSVSSAERVEISQPAPLIVPDVAEGATLTLETGAPPEIANDPDAVADYVGDRIADGDFAPEIKPSSPADPENPDDPDNPTDPDEPEDPEIKFPWLSKIIEWLRRIWEAITSLPEFIASAIGRLFIPPDDWVSGLPDLVQNSFPGDNILNYPIKASGDIIQRTFTLAPRDPVFEWGDIREPKTGVVVFPAGRFEFASLKQNPVFANALNVAKVIMGGSAIFGFLGYLDDRWCDLLAIRRRLEFGDDSWGSGDGG